MTAKSKIVRCPTCKRPRQRSVDANARYWALLHEISEHVKTADGYYSVDSWHNYFKSRYLGCNDVTLPNGITLTIPKSTARLDVGQFNDYMTKVEAWASEHEVYLEDIAA